MWLILLNCRPDEALGLLSFVMIPTKLLSRRSLACLLTIACFCVGGFRLQAASVTFNRIYLASDATAYDANTVSIKITAPVAITYGAATFTSQDPSAPDFGTGNNINGTLTFTTAAGSQSLKGTVSRRETDGSKVRAFYFYATNATWTTPTGAAYLLVVSTASIDAEAYFGTETSSGTVQASIQTNSANVVTSLNAYLATQSGAAPVVSTSAGSTSGASLPVLIDAALTVSDADSVNLTGALVSITGNFAAGDTLVSTGTNGSISASYNATTGVLTMSGTATKAAWQTELRAVQFATSSGDTATRTITFRATDGEYWSVGATKNVTLLSLLPQTITFPAISNQTYPYSTVTLAATASSGLAVTYTLVAGPATLSGNTLTITGPGTITVMASQPGNGTYEAAPDAYRSFDANPAPQTITFPAISNQTYPYSTVTLAATASSGLPVTYAVTSGPATVSGSTLTITGPGTITVTASQAGNSSYQAAPDVSRSFDAGPAPQTITFPALSDTVYPAAPVTLAATASSGLPVAYAVVSGPATVSGSTLTITGSGTITVKASQAGNANYLAATDVQRSFVVAAGSYSLT